MTLFFSPKTAQGMTSRVWRSSALATAALAAASWLASCATPPPAENKSNAEINAGRSVPDAPGDAGETGPKSDQKDPAAPAKAAPAAKAEKVAPAPAAAGDMFANDFVNVRSGPGMKFDVVRKLDRGAKVTAQGTENEIWTKIGEKEYVASKFLSKDAPAKK